MTTSPGELARARRAADGCACATGGGCPDGDVRATVQIVHGASEHSGRYGRLAQRAHRAGLAVYAMDLRGHGRTAEGTGIGRFGAPGVTACSTTSTRCTW